MDERVEDLFREASRVHPTASLSRIRDALLNPEVRPSAHFQNPGFLFLPFLSGSAWHSTPNAPWVTEFEDSFEAIRNEFNELSESNLGFSQYVEPEGSPPFWKGDWRACYFFHSGIWFPETVSACPMTANLLRKVHRLDEYALYSSLEPGGEIKPHSGPWNARLTFHFGVQIPEASQIRVGGVTRKWKEGSFIVFDDSFEHEASNKDSSARVVVMFTVWHPELSDVEIEILKRYDRLFPIAGHQKYLDQLLANSRSSYNRHSCGDT